MRGHTSGVIKDLVGDRDLSLPSLPALALRLLEAVKEDAYEALARLVQFDPALSAKILQVANSPLFSRGQKIDTLETAIALLGTEMLKNIALSFVLVRSFQRETKDEFDFTNFWRRAITAAISAELMADRCGLSRERLYLSGLLMDVGILVMYLCRPEDYLRVFDEKRTGEFSTIESERRIFGFDHQAVGSEMISVWGLPPYLREHILYHHFPSEAPAEIGKEVEALHLADKIAGIYFTFRALDKYNFILRRAEESLGLSSHDAEDLVDETARRTREILDIFELPVREIRPYSEILAEANRELQRLILSYAQLLQKLREEKARAEALAEKLREANCKLMEMALRDGLTELYNRRYFQERFSEEFHRSRRYGQPLTVVIADVDHFKRINDTYGHLFGDEVLKRVADIFRKNVRQSDIVARYGGEEFVVLLPSTDIKGGTVLAERLRRQIEKEEFRFKGEQVKVTASFGVASLSPESQAGETEFLAAADKALYVSKQKGRNRVTAVTL